MILELRACALPFKQWVFHWDSVVRSPHKAPYFQGYGPMGKVQIPQETGWNCREYEMLEEGHIFHQIMTISDG